MTFRNKIYVTIFGILEFIAVLFFLGFVAARAAEASDNASEQKMVTGPEPHDIRLVSFDPWVVEGELLGAVAAYIYDDVTTKRPADYWELYNKEGDLLAVSCLTDSVSEGQLSIAELPNRRMNSKELSLSS